MPTGPIPAEIAIICDWAERGDYNIRAVTEQLSRLGVVSTACFITSILDAPPPIVDGVPDIDEYISKRKTCPGVGWEKHGDKWVASALVEGLKRVRSQLEEVQPKVVITLGEAALLMLTGKSSISAWGGSRLSLPQWPFTIIPTFHPRALIKQPGERFILNMDLERAYNVYVGKQLPRIYQFTLQPTFDQATSALFALLAAADKNPIQVSADIETRAGHIACMGFAWSANTAICIPHLIVRPEGSLESPFYWSLEDEAIIVSLYAQLFAHPNITWPGQNFTYDCQYFYRHWGILPRQVFDTMVGHHSLHSNIKKGLAFLSRMYAQDHVYWKDEINEWDPIRGELQYWEYNCKDCCITFEIADQIAEALKDRNTPQHTEFQQKLFFPVLRMMNRGIKWDSTKCSTIRKELVELQFNRQQQLNWVVGHDLNPRSSAQLQKLFYTDFGIPGIKALNSDSFTTNSPTMAIIAEREPMLKPLCQLVVELRSIGVFLSTFIDAGLDIDGRMRSDFAIAGPVTYRFASRGNAFNSGMNFQNIPVKEKQKIKDDNYVKLPNVRELFIPDYGQTFFDIDLDRADMQVVGWESGDENLKAALRKGIDLHCMSAAEIFGIRGIPVDELVESHPNYADHRAKIGKGNRDKTKNGGHACDYAVGDRKLAQTLGITTHEASAFKARWFGLFPGIRKWHIRTEQEVSQQGYIENKFGARLYNFGRFNLPEFLGWLPQSTVAGVINRALEKIDAAAERGETSIELLIQVHDSLAGQFSTNRSVEEIQRLKDLARILVPYADPLYIPVGVKTSTISWGHCK